MMLFQTNQDGGKPEKFWKFIDVNGVTLQYNNKEKYEHDKDLFLNQLGFDLTETERGLYGSSKTYSGDFVWRRDPDSPDTPKYLYKRIPMKMPENPKKYIVKYSLIYTRKEPVLSSNFIQAKAPVPRIIITNAQKEELIGMLLRGNEYTISEPFARESDDDGAKRYFTIMASAGYLLKQPDGTYASIDPFDPAYKKSLYSQEPEISLKLRQPPDKKYVLYDFLDFIWAKCSEMEGGGTGNKKENLKKIIGEFFENNPDISFTAVQTYLANAGKLFPKYEIPSPQDYLAHIELMKKIPDLPARRPASEKIVKI